MQSFLDLENEEDLADAFQTYNKNKTSYTNFFDGNTYSNRLTIDQAVSSLYVDDSIKNGNDLHGILEGRNIVFLETTNEGFVSSVSSMLNAFNGRVIDIEEELDFEREIILYTTNKNRAFEGNNISNYDLSNLQFHFPSVNKSFDYEIENNFVKAYKVKYGAEPNRYATRGFDLTFDLLLRLSTQDNLFVASSSDIETEYIENKFRYSKKLFGGYINEASYIMKYEDLKLIEVKQ